MTGLGCGIALLIALKERQHQKFLLYDLLILKVHVPESSIMLIAVDAQAFKKCFEECQEKMKQQESAAEEVEKKLQNLSVAEKKEGQQEQSPQEQPPKQDKKDEDDETY